MQTDCDNYGFDFTAYTLETVHDKDWKDAEKKWMHYFNTGDPKFGYNYLDKKAKKRSVDSFPIYQNDVLLRKNNTYKKFESLLTKKNCTIKEVCEATKLGRSTLSRWKLGKCMPKPQKMMLICNFFDVPSDYFYSAQD